MIFLKKIVLVDISYCPKNEEFLKRFMKEFDVRIKWITKKVRQLFKLESRNPHISCGIYGGVFSCQNSYIGETVRNVENRWQEHEDTAKDLEPAKHFKNNPIHSFTGKFLPQASSNRCIRQKHETTKNIAL